MSVAYKKVEGVASVEVSLKEGTAQIVLKRGNRVDPERFRQLARDNGFTPKGSEVRVAGRVIEQGGKPALEVSGLALIYELQDHADSKGRITNLEKVIGKTVIVNGYLPETAARPDVGALRILQVREISIDPH